jgi:hypothetical protein
MLLAVDRIGEKEAADLRAARGVVVAALAVVEATRV